MLGSQWNIAVFMWAHSGPDEERRRRTATSMKGSKQAKCLLPPPPLVTNWQRGLPIMWPYHFPLITGEGWGHMMDSSLNYVVEGGVGPHSQ